MIYKMLLAEDCDAYGETLAECIYESVKNSAYTGTYVWEDALQKKEELKEYLAERKALAYGAIDGDRLAGFVWAYRYPFRDDKDRIYVSILHVKEEYRNQGTGDRLLGCIETEAERQGIQTVFLHTEAFNKGALRFYDRKGYRKERIQLVKRLNNIQMPEYIGGEKIRKAEADDISAHMDTFPGYLRKT